MVYQKQLPSYKHFKTFANFSTKKVSINRDNDSYVTYSLDGDGNIQKSSITFDDPEILWEDFVYIDSPVVHWTHGIFYYGDKIDVPNIIKSNLALTKENNQIILKFGDDVISEVDI